jgi:hypothetical protein
VVVVVVADMMGKSGVHHVPRFALKSKTLGTLLAGHYQGTIATAPGMFTGCHSTNNWLCLSGSPIIIIFPFSLSLSLSVCVCVCVLLFPFPVPAAESKFGSKWPKD